MLATKQSSDISPWDIYGLLRPYTIIYWLCLHWTIITLQHIKKTMVIVLSTMCFTTYWFQFYFHSCNFFELILKLSKVDTTQVKNTTPENTNFHSPPAITISLSLGTRSHCGPIFKPFSPNSASHKQNNTQSALFVTLLPLSSTGKQ